MLVIWRSGVENFNFLKYCLTANDEVADKNTIFILFQTLQSQILCFAGTAKASAMVQCQLQRSE